MEKDVLISLIGLQTTDVMQDNTTVVSPGQYYLKNGKHYLIYEGTDEEGEITSNTIRIGTDEIMVRRKGKNSTEMLFRPDCDTEASYRTPMGMLLLGIHTDRIRMRETDNSLTVLINYSLSVDDSKLADYYIRIEVKPRTERLQLR